jgi:cell division protease FtsH
MSTNLITEKDLPVSLTTDQSVEAAYSTELAEVASKLLRGLPVLVEADKDVAPYLFVNVRNRLKAQNIKCIYLDGRPNTGQATSATPTGLIGTMIAQLRDAVRGAVERRVVVLPHLDLLTTSQGGLTGEAREVIPLLYENPELVWLGFKDPSFPLPKVIENLFAHHISLLGVSRNRLAHLITQKEARKFGRSFTPWQLYKYVSGVNAAKLRRLLSTLEGEDYPADPRGAYRQLRQATLTGTLEIPDVNLEHDVGGYDVVKKRLRQEIIDVLAKRDASTNVDDVAKLEELIPRGMILWGPPGTGKTFFAKAIATAIGAALTVVSGPELKSKWVGESEENLRQIFHRARQSAPAIIVFDELDSFATARGMYSGSGVEHSMVNQLLTEMDGFHKEELVFVVGTTNFVESLDPALLRPGRFEFHLHIPYPDDDDRRAIFKIYDQKMRLKMTPEALEYSVRRTGEGYMTAQGTAYSGDHIQAMCRAVARIRLREGRDGESTPNDMERGLTEYEEKKDLTPEQAMTVASHESGHFLVAVLCEHHADPDRITIQSEMPWAGGYVRYNPKEFSHLGELGHTRQELLDDLCVLLGGIEAERLLCQDVSSGAGGSDLRYATHIAHLVVEWLGMGESTGLRQYRDPKDGERMILSGGMADVLDKQINALFKHAQERAQKYMSEYREDLIALRNEVLEVKVLEQERIQTWINAFRAKHNLPGKKRRELKKK